MSPFADDNVLHFPPAAVPWQQRQLLLKLTKRRPEQGGIHGDCQHGRGEGDRPVARDGLPGPGQHQLEACVSTRSTPLVRPCSIFDACSTQSFLRPLESSLHAAHELTSLTCRCGHTDGRWLCAQVLRGVAVRCIWSRSQARQSRGISSCAWRVEGTHRQRRILLVGSFWRGSH